MLPDQLWSHVRRRSTEDLQLLRIGAKGRKSEVNDFDHICFILYQDIVELDITVCYTSGVQELESLRDLPEKLSAN